MAYALNFPGDIKLCANFNVTVAPAMLEGLANCKHVIKLKRNANAQV